MTNERRSDGLVLCHDTSSSDSFRAQSTGGAESRAQGSFYTHVLGKMGWLFSSADGVP